MKRLAAWTAIAWLAAGCAGAGTAPREERAHSLSALYDGHYDNNTFLVDSRRMSLARVIESLYPVSTEVTFRAQADGRILQKDLKGTGVALSGGYLLTVAHVVSLEGITVDTLMGSVLLPVTKVRERSFLEHGGERYELERLLLDKGVDVALFRLPKGLTLKSFPYPIGNSDDLQVGNFVYLVGNPMNLGFNVREGIVSSLQAPKVISRVNSIAENAFMVSNGLNPGDSGTPVIGIRDGVYEIVGLSQGSFLASQRLGWVIRINSIVHRIETSQGTHLAARARK